MSTRPYIAFSLKELEDYVNRSYNDLETLRDIQRELDRRRRNRRLGRVRDHLAAVLAQAEKNAPLGEPCNDQNERFEATTEIEADLPNESNLVSFDKKQKAVVELPENSAKVIEAGPGTGKTAVACARVAYLVEEKGLEASKILLISFTRAAVKELRDRIRSFAKHESNMAGVQILTLDSLTWQVLNGFESKDSKQITNGYDENIRKFSSALASDNPQLLDYLEEFEHVILDEGQDLVGERANLAVDLIEKLEENCGVSVFTDSAQAIYGFTEDSAEPLENSTLSLIERINGGELRNFETLYLDAIHRTKDPQLKKLFSTGRRRLLLRKESDPDQWLEMRQLIESCAHGRVPGIDDQKLLDKEKVLVLFRSRAEVLMGSSILWSNNVPHKVRMSKTQERISPWIGRIFGDFIEDRVNREKFADLWHKKIESDEKIGIPDEPTAWQILTEYAGNNHGEVVLRKLRELLSRERPPIEFIIDESVLPGPVLGTIHASKGREADCVHLMLPPATLVGNGSDISPSQILEEERVLFVGATRAKKRLLTGEGRRYFVGKLSSGRAYRTPHRGGARRQVEFGIRGDVDVLSSADGTLGSDVRDLQEWLWKNRFSDHDARATYDSVANAYIIYVDDRPIGVLSKKFSRELWQIAKKVGERVSKSMKPSPSLRYLRFVGATTTVISENVRADAKQPWNKSGVILIPVISGFPVVYFNPWKGSKNAR